MKNGIERRICRRFGMKLPAIIQISPASNRNQYRLALTKDISHSGAYFNIMKPISHGETVHVEILLEIQIENNKIMHLYMAVSGKIVRHEESGLAVNFNDDCRLLPFHSH
ncbi:MAG: PilZ domain-containing protein [Thermodesulfobacteriota bacterium]